MVVDSSSSCLDTGEPTCNWEVQGDVEGDLLLEWSIDLDLLAIHSSCPPSSAKNVDAQKIVASTFGDNHPVRTLIQLLFHLGWWLRLDIMGPVSQ